MGLGSGRTEVLQNGPESALEPWAARVVSEALAAQGLGHERSWDLQYNLTADKGLGGGLSANDRGRTKDERNLIREAGDCFVWKGMEEDGVA